MVSVGPATTVGVVTSARENRADMALKIPVVAEPGQRVAVSRRIGGKWRLIGDGVVEEGWFCGSPTREGGAGTPVNMFIVSSNARTGVRPAPLSNFLLPAPQD